MNSITIREASPADLPQLMQLIAQSDMSPDNCLTADQAKELYNKIAATGCHTIYVAELNSAIVGTFSLIVVQQLSHNGAKSIIAEDVVVKSELQGQGIGQQMMKFATELGQALGCYKIALSSGNARTEAHAFYEKFGFKKDGYRFALELAKKSK